MQINYSAARVAVQGESFTPAAPTQYMNSSPAITATDDVIYSKSDVTIRQTINYTRREWTLPINGTFYRAGDGAELVEVSGAQHVRGVDQTLRALKVFGVHNGTEREWRLSGGYSSTSGYLSTTAYTAGTLAANAWNLISAVLPTLSVSATSDIYYATRRIAGMAGGSLATPIGAWAAQCWAAQWDTSAVCLGRQSTSGAQYYSLGALPITLIKTNQSDVLFGLVAWHTKILVGEQVVFLRTDGTFHTATVAAGQQIYFETAGSDVQLVMFSAPVTGCTPVGTLPADWANYHSMSDFGITATGVALPCIFVGSRYTAAIESMFPTRDTTRISPALLVHKPLVFPGTSEFGVQQYIAESDGGFQSEDIRYRYNSMTWQVQVGDSSGPYLVPTTSSELAVVSLASTVSTGSAIPLMRDEINAAMDTLASAAPGTWLMHTVSMSPFAQIRTTSEYTTA
jgi:hypothetical protein